MTQAIPDHRNIALIGAPSSAGARMLGQERAPAALREAGLVSTLQSAGLKVTDLGDTDTVRYSPDRRHPKRQNLDRVVGVLKQVEAKVESALSRGGWPLVIGGDCTVTIGVLSALTGRYPDLCMLYVDGDVDLNTPDTTLTGILDGMVLAHILGSGAGELCDFGSRRPLLEEDKITLFGYSFEAGGIDPVELERLKVAAMHRYPLADVIDDTSGAASRALKELEASGKHILVHFDVDVIDEGDFPVADVPHKPALRFEQVQQALRIFLGSPKTIGLVVTEFNADRDADGSLAGRLIDLIRTATSGAAAAA